jgi:lipoate-protein ligase B
MGYAPALELQARLVRERKEGAIPDQLLLVEHPHVITLGRNGRMENVLAGEEVLRRSGIDFHPTDRGGDVTYHGPGQLVGYPILDLREWRREVVGYVRAVEQVLIDALAEFGIGAGWHVIEQQVYADAGDTIESLDLLCSGFHPAAEPIAPTPQQHG